MVLRARCLSPCQAFVFWGKFCPSAHLESASLGSHGWAYTLGMLGSGAGQSLSATRVSILMVKVGQTKQRPSSENSRQISEKRTLVGH